MSTIIGAIGSGVSSGSSTAIQQTLAAIGSGTADDGPSIRSQLASATSGTTIYAIPGKTYLLGSTVSSSSFVVPSGTTTRAYCLAIPDGVTLDMRGSTLKLGTGVDATMVTSVGTATNAAHSGVGLVNAVLDGNNVALTSKALAVFAKATRLTLSVRVINGVQLGVHCYNIDRCDFPLLDADGFTGNPFSFGQSSPAGNEVRDCRFGIIRARNVVPDPANTFNMPGNSLAGVFQRCSFDLIEARSCTAGIKIEQPSSDLVIGRVLVDSCGDSSGNSGLKLQGTSTSTSTQVKRVSVGEVVATNQTGHGLWMEYSSDCHIGSFTGNGNNTLATGPDVWVGGTRDTIDSINSTQAGGAGILFRPYAADVRLGAVTVRNPGQVSAAASKVGVSIPAGTGTIGSITAIDDQGSPTMFRGVDVTGTGAVIQCSLVYAKGATGSNVVVTTGGSTLLRTRLSGNPTYAELALAGTADAITVGQAISNTLRSGLWYPSLPCSGLTTSQIPNQSLRLTPMDVPRSLTVSGLAVEVTAAGEASSTFRFGIYADDGTGYPGVLVLDAGTVAADSTGVKTITISQALTPGRYWVGGVTQGAATTAATIRTPANAMVSIGSSTTPGTGSSVLAYNQTGVAGALPTPFTTSVSAAGQSPRIYVQIA